MDNNFLNLHDLLMAVSILESLFLSIFFALMPIKQWQANRILALLFLLVAGVLTGELIIWNAYLQTREISHWRIAPATVSICLLLEGPTLYLYLHSLSYGTRLWQRSNAIHLLPALICLAIVMAFNITPEEWLPSRWSSISANTRTAVIIVWALFKSVPAAYAMACFYAEYRLRQEMKQMYANISQLELIVVDIVLAGFFLSWLWSFAGYLVSGHISSEANELIGNVSDYLTTLLLNTLFIFGLINTRQLLYTPPAEEEVTLAEIQLPAEKIDAIERGIRTQQLHLDSDINLKGFAEQVGLKPRELSNIINSHYGSNFFEFINRFRIEEAKRLLIEKEAKNAILDIVYKSGFNSPSVFHRFFKRIEGVTPSEYRKREKATETSQKNPFLKIIT